MKIVSHSNTADVLAAAIRGFRDALTRAKDTPTLLLLSGGSALALLDPTLAEMLDKRVTIGMLDERHTNDPRNQNFTQLTHTDFYSRARERGCVFLSTIPKQSESLAENAERFEQSLRAWCAEHPEGHVIATQGIGADGHTAGILPFPEDPALFTKHFDNPLHWVAGYAVTPEKNPHRERITVTLPFLRSMVSETIVYAVGKEKHDALARTLAARGLLVETPARIIHEMSLATLFTDYTYNA